MFEWAPGAVVRAKLSEGGAYFEIEVRELWGGRAAGLLIPVDVLRAHDLVAGDEIDVPYHEWITVTTRTWPDEGLDGQQRRAEAHAREMKARPR